MNKQRNIPINEFTSPSPATVTPDTPYEKIVQLLVENGFRHLPVIFEEEVVGIVSERNVKFPVTSASPIGLFAKDIMTPDPFTVDSEASLEEVALEMSQKKIGSAIVLEDGKLLGIFTTTDALNALVEILRGDY